MKWFKKIKAYLRQERGKYIHSKVIKDIVKEDRESYVKKLKRYGYVDYTE
jgi:hypothetical protein